VTTRPRSARFAALALAVTTPLLASYAAPAFADGADADVSAIVTDGNVHVSSSKDLSRTTIVFCEGEPLVIPSWPEGQQEADIEVEGVVQAVFIHSGNNTTDEAQAILADLAPEVLAGNSTGELAYPENADDVGKACEETEEPPGDTEEPPGDTEEPPGETEEPPGETEEPADDTEEPVTTTAAPAETIVLGVTLEQPTNPAPAVGGSNLEVLAELPRTGAGSMQFLVALALSLLAAGVILRAAFSRRIRSASSSG
jgi:hypothetical protein